MDYNIWIIIFSFLTLLFIFLFVRGYIICISDDYYWSFLFAIIFGGLLAYCITNYIWDINKKVSYIKPHIILLKETNSTVKCLIDNKEVIEMPWFSINDTYWKLEYYKDRTIKELVIKKHGKILWRQYDFYKLTWKMIKMTGSNLKSAIQYLLN